jgi:hypothetical protein
MLMAGTCESSQEGRMYLFFPPSSLSICKSRPGAVFFLQKTYLGPITSHPFFLLDRTFLFPYTFKIKKQPLSK